MHGLQVCRAETERPINKLFTLFFNMDVTDVGATKSKIIIFKKNVGVLFHKLKYISCPNVQ